jgi:hypothetical protein
VYSSKISAGAVVGITIGLVALLFVLLFVTILLRRRIERDGQRCLPMTSVTPFWRGQGVTAQPVTNTRYDATNRNAEVGSGVEQIGLQDVERQSPSRLSYLDPDYGYQRAQWSAFWPAEKSAG